MSKRSRFSLVLALGALICLPRMALANVVNFDDLPTPYDQGSAFWGTVPTDYLGYTWTGDWEIQENNSFKSVYNNNGDFPSLHNAAYNDSGAALMAISFPNAITVSDAYFRSWSQNDQFQPFSATSVTLKGYDGATVVDTLVVALSATEMIHTAIDFAGIDKIEFITNSDKWWLMDNMNVVPIPGGLWLLGSGLVALIGIRRRIDR
ncbi:MAG: hypothetical protein SWE60_08385 [Thermodesulfobacteriota bacterium]|nr:hypothetical protein [Thermodesulfobacteriota bacterium]